MHARNVHAVRANVGTGQAGLGHDGGGQQGGRRFALGAGDADDVQLVSRIAVKVGTDDRQRGAGVCGDDLRGIGRQIQRMLAQKGAAAVFVGAGGVGVAVQPGTHLAEEQRTEAPVWGMCWTKSFSFIGDILFSRCHKSTAPAAAAGHLRCKNAR